MFAVCAEPWVQPCFPSSGCCTLSRVEHPCPKCGAPVEEGVPFCRTCRAPQIRVPGLESSEPVVVPEVHGTTEVVPLLPQPPPVPQATPSKIHWSQALPYAALGGVCSLLLLISMTVLRVGSSIALIMFGLAFMVGGASSARMYYRKVKESPARPAAGAKIGAASGGFGFLFFAVLMVATVIYQADELRKAMADTFAQLSKPGYDPAMARRFLESLQTPGGLATFVAFVLLVMCLIFVIGGSIGGAWYCAWLRKRTGT